MTASEHVVEAVALAMCEQGRHEWGSGEMDPLLRLESDMTRAIREIRRLREHFCEVGEEGYCLICGDAGRRKSREEAPHAEAIR